MSATAEKPAKSKPKARVAARDLGRALGPARSAKAQVVKIDPKDRTLRFDTPTLAAVLPFAGTRGSGRVVRVKRGDLAHVVRSVGGGDVLIGEDDGRLCIDAPRATVVLPEARIDPRQDREHPFDGEETLTLDARALARTLLRTEPFASRDGSRPTLASVALDMHRGNVVATDSFRLAICGAPELLRRRKGAPPLLLRIDGVVPLAVALASVGGDVEVALGAKHATFTFGDQRWSVATGDGVYPNYADLLPAEGDWNAVVELNATELADAAALIAGLSIRNACAVLTLAESGGATLAVRGSDGPRCTVTLDADVTAAARSEVVLDPIGVNADFLLAAARALAPEDIVLKVISPLRPMLLKGADAMHLVMPIRFRNGA